MKYFAAMKDHRHPSYTRHPLTTIIGITIAAVICGAKDWYDIEDYGREKATWLGQFLDISNGIPSHDTFRLFFLTCDPQALQDCFIEWVKEVADLAEGRIISVDGKTLKGSKRSEHNYFIHLVSAWCSTNNMVLGQQKVDQHSNEITAIPLLLDRLMLKGCLVTIDAMGCQQQIAEKVVNNGADYLLAVKGNQQVLLDDIKEAFTYAKAQDSYSQTEVGHGRVETRTVSVITDTDWLCNKEDWVKLACLVMVFSKRYDKKTGEEQTSERYYISSSKATAKYFCRAVRSHWEIENKLHWMLDVSFGEDSSKKQAGDAAQNFSLISKVALNMIQNHRDTEYRGTKKISAKRKRNMAAWNNDYLLEILLSFNH
ncbi:MAG TPA: ISAs1 family transposase [Nitrososphaera sp.]|jgi:predicted transposase YbfD/YdcC|nr:ISAs1 family transposase [Nitrososphaera sp.]